MEALVNELITNYKRHDAELPATDSEGGECPLIPRIEGPLTAVVVVGAVPEGTRSIAMLENLSADDFYLRLADRMKPGEELLASARVSRAVVLMHGTVVRVEELENGIFGLAVTILQYRILSEVMISEEVSNNPPFVGAEFLRAEA